MKIEATKDECHEAYFRFLGLKRLTHSRN